MADVEFCTVNSSKEGGRLAKVAGRWLVQEEAAAVPQAGLLLATTITAVAVLVFVRRAFTPGDRAAKPLKGVSGSFPEITCQEITELRTREVAIPPPPPLVAAPRQTPTPEITTTNEDEQSSSDSVEAPPKAQKMKLKKKSKKAVAATLMQKKKKKSARNDTKQKLNPVVDLALEGDSPKVTAKTQEEASTSTSTSTSSSVEITTTTTTTTSVVTVAKPLAASKCCIRSSSAPVIRPESPEKMQEDVNKAHYAEDMLTYCEQPSAPPADKAQPIIPVQLPPAAIVPVGQAPTRIPTSFNTYVPTQPDASFPSDAEASFSSTQGQTNEGLEPVKLILGQEPWEVETEVPRCDLELSAATDSFLRCKGFITWCRDDINGNCQWGTRCRYAHVVNQDTRRWLMDICPPIPKQMCPQDLRCELVNDPDHQEQFRHTCRIPNCDMAGEAWHAIPFYHKPAPAAPAAPASPAAAAPVRHQQRQRCPDQHYWCPADEEGVFGRSSAQHYQQPAYHHQQPEHCPQQPEYQQQQSEYHHQQEPYYDQFFSDHYSEPDYYPDYCPPRFGYNQQY